MCFLDLFWREDKNQNITNGIFLIAALSFTESSIYRIPTKLPGVRQSLFLNCRINMKHLTIQSFQNVKLLFAAHY